MMNLRARALPLGTYYRMDAMIDAFRPMKWPAADVLFPAHLTSDTIGVIGWVESGAKKIFVPLFVSDHPPPSTSEANVVAILRSTVDLEKFLWRSWVQGEKVDPLPQWKTALASDPVALRASEPIRLELRIERGITVVETAAKLPDLNRWVKLEALIYKP